MLPVKARFDMWTMPSSKACGDGRCRDTRTKANAGSKINTLLDAEAETGVSAGCMRTRDSPESCGCTRPSDFTLRSRVQRILMTLHGRSISNDVKKFECWTTYRARAFFAISGRNNEGSAYIAIRKSPCAQDGVVTTSFPVSKVDRMESITAFCFTLPATRWFIASI